MIQEQLDPNHKRYCSSCGKYRPVDGGKLCGPRNQHWRCASCVDKAIKREGKVRRIKDE